MIVIAIALEVFSRVIATYISYHINAKIGGSIVMLQILLFLIAMILHLNMSDS